VKTIVRELGGEKIDIIKYFSDPREMIMEALKPAVPREIILDEKNHRIILRSATDDLAVADRPQGPECAPHLAPHRLAHRHRGIQGGGEDPRATPSPCSSRLSASTLHRRSPRGHGINSPAAFEGVAAEDLVGGGFTADEAKDIIGRVTPS